MQSHLELKQLTVAVVIDSNMELKAIVLANDGVSDGGNNLGKEVVTSSVEGNGVKIYYK